MTRDARCLAPPGSAQRAAYEADMLLSRVKPQARRWRAPRLVRRVGPGECLPRGFGLAWVRYSSGTAVCLPLPFNVVASCARAVWLWFKRGGLPLSERADEAFDAGVAFGLGRAAGWIERAED